MMKKIVIPFLGIILFNSCDTTPASEQDGFERKNEQASEEISPNGLKAGGDKASIIAMADVKDPEDENFSGKAYFTLQEDIFTLTLILNNADPETYSIYLTENSNCDNPTTPGSERMDNEEYAGNVGSIKVMDDGTGRTEIILRQFSDSSTEEIKDYNILLAEPDGEIRGCGTVKKYIEQQNLSK